MNRDNLIEHFKKSTVVPEEVWEDVDVAKEIVYSLLPLYKDDIIDYDSLLNGKTAIAFGFSNNEKRYLKRHIEEHGGKFRFTKNDIENFFIVNNDTWLYDMLYALRKAREEDAIIVDYEHFTKFFEDTFSNEDEERRKEIERKEKYARQKGPIYKSMNTDDLSCIPTVDKKELSLEDDIFHVVGRIDNFIWDNVINFSRSLKNKNDVYAYIEEKGGQFIKKESNRITCVIFGTEPAESAILGYLNKVKLIDADSFFQWLSSQPVINEKCREFGKNYTSSVDSRLRPYQQDIKQRIFKKWNSYFNVMLQLPTGTGKTILFTSIIKDLIRDNKTKILILAHRKELIDQISEHLTKYKIGHGLITSGRVRRLEYNVQVASIQTITHKDNQDVIDVIAPQFIIIDEAHHSLAKTYTTFWKKCKNTWKLGVTATPYRLNKKSFKGYFDQLVMSYDIEKFIELGYLSSYTLYVDNPNSDLSKAIDAIKERSSTGDYRIKDLLDVLNVEKHIQKLVLCYLQYANGKKGIVYAVSKEHAYNICQAYQKIGVTAEYIDSETNKTTRQNIIERFKKGEISVMVNVNIFSEGFDCPDIDFIQLARPTWSLALFLQQVGRGMRISCNKEKTIILDNAALWTRFSYPSSHREWGEYFEGNKYMWEADWNEMEKINRIRNLSFTGKDLMIKIPSLQDKSKSSRFFVSAKADSSHDENTKKIRTSSEIEKEARRKEILENQIISNKNQEKDYLKSQRDIYEARKEKMRKDAKYAEWRSLKRIQREKQEDKERENHELKIKIGVSVIIAIVVIILFITGLWPILCIFGVIMALTAKK